MIPKIIHYCWFGNKHKSKKVLECIQSWERYAPEFKIMEWNERNFDVNIISFSKEAYQHKKFAFVADVARVYALLNYGGIYLDTDTELVCSFPEKLLQHDAFAGFEESDYDYRIGTALLASSPQHPLFEQFFTQYVNRKFIEDNGQVGIIPNTVILTQLMIESGLVLDNKHQQIRGMHIYPKDYFSPKSYLSSKVDITTNTICIHHFEKSWMPYKMRVWCFLRIHCKTLSNIIRVIYKAFRH